MEKVVIINSPLYFTYKAQKREGITVIRPYSFGSTRLTHKLRLMAGKYYRNLKWYNKKLINYGAELFILNDLFDPKFIKWLREVNPNSRIAVIYGNPVQYSLLPPDVVKDLGCEVWSFDKKDCKKYGLKYSGYCFYKSWIISEKKIIYDAFFIGREKGRYTEIKAFIKELKKNGLKVYVHIVPDKNRIFIDPRKYKRQISFDKVLHYVACSKAVIDIQQQGQSGMDVRVLESLFNGKKLFINNNRIREEEFYHPDNIFIIGEDDYSKIPEFMNKPFNHSRNDKLDKITFPKHIDRIYRGIEF